MTSDGFAYERPKDVLLGRGGPIYGARVQGGVEAKVQKQKHSWGTSQFLLAARERVLVLACVWFMRAGGNGEGAAQQV